MQLIAILVLAAFPFVGALLLAWLGPRRSFSARYRRARQRTAAMAAAADHERERLDAAIQRLAASQQRLQGESPEAPPPDQKL